MANHEFATRFSQFSPMAPTLVGGGIESDEEQQAGFQSVIRALQGILGRPTVPDNPLAQLGVMLSGFAAGTQGKPNPVLEQFQTQRRQDLEATTAGASLGFQIQREQRQERTLRQQEARHRLEFQASLADKLFKMGNETDNADLVIEALQRYKQLGVPLQIDMEQFRANFKDKRVREWVKGFTEAQLGFMAVTGTVPPGAGAVPGAQEFATRLQEDPVLQSVMGISVPESEVKVSKALMTSLLTKHPSQWGPGGDQALAWVKPDEALALAFWAESQGVKTPATKRLTEGALLDRDTKRAELRVKGLVAELHTLEIALKSAELPVAKRSMLALKASVISRALTELLFTAVLAQNTKLQKDTQKAIEDIAPLLTLGSPAPPSTTPGRAATRAEAEMLKRLSPEARGAKIQELGINPQLPLVP